MREGTSDANAIGTIPIGVRRRYGRRGNGSKSFLKQESPSALRCHVLQTHDESKTIGHLRLVHSDAIRGNTRAPTEKYPLYRMQKLVK